MKVVKRCGQAALAVAGVAAVGAVALPGLAKADSPSCAARVTGISSVLDTFATGSAAGPSVATTAGPAVAPGDTSLRQTATIVRGAQEDTASC